GQHCPVGGSAKRHGHLEEAHGEWRRRAEQAGGGGHAEEEAVDSHVVAELLAKYLSTCASKCEDLDNCVTTAYEELYSKYVREGDALITGLLSYCGGGDVRLYATSLVRGYENLDDMGKAYYSVYVVSGNGYSIVSSSTLVDYYIRLSNFNKLVQQQKVLKIERDSIKTLLTI
ncbi:MAG: hypothetical protein ACP5KB_07145, partial [Thermoprotei archaeon]